MSEARRLFDRYVRNQCSREEVETLMMYFHTDREEELSQLILKELEEPDTDSGDRGHEALLASAYRHIRGQIRDDVQRSRPAWVRVAAAAAVLLVLSASSYFLLHKAVPAAKPPNQDLPFGTNQAVLKLGNGRMVVLDSSANGLIARQGNMAINKTAAGQLVYSVSGQTETAEPEAAYDTLINPAGARLYNLKLADGSSLILNAATTICFPNSFQGKERRIDLLSGELYADITHNEEMPFRIYTGNLSIEDLGTHFNVNAYQDEPRKKITLLEGSVRISSKGKGVMLKPGQQAISDNMDNLKIVNGADIDEAVAWKEGTFRFDGEDLESIMRQVSRWYDVPVVYADESVKKLPFGAVTTRFANISQVLRMLERTREVHFKIEGKRIIVSK
jgi:transmembrane sensor